MTDNTTICKRCLLRDIDKNEYFKSIYEYIDSISEELKAPSDEYESRLLKCRSCDNLVNGMCKVCGCFVEARASKLSNYCPGVNKLW